MRIALFSPQTSSSSVRSVSKRIVVTASSDRPVQQSSTHTSMVLDRRTLLASAVVIGSVLSGSRAAEAARGDARVNGDFIELPSGVLVEDILEGKGPEPKVGALCAGHSWCSEGLRSRRFGPLQSLSVSST